MANHTRDMSEKCFLCGKETVIGFDFITVEIWRSYVQTAKYEQYASRERIAGIVRLTLCADCMKNKVQLLKSDRTKKDGKPKLFQKGAINSLDTLLDKMDHGVYENSIEMENIFIASFGAMWMEPDNRYFHIKLDKYGRAIEAQYVLWTPENEAFSHQIVPELNAQGKESSFTLYSMSLLSTVKSESVIVTGQLSNMLSLEKNTCKQLYEIVKLYNDILLKH